MKKLFLVIAAVLAIPVLSGCSTVSTDANQIALHYNAGPMSSSKFDSCVPASKREFNGPFDQYFFYPTDQRFVDATGAENSDFGAVTVVSKDNVEMQIPVTVNFFLKTDCETLRKFHESVGKRFAAYNTQASDTMSPGWKEMLRVIIYQPMDTTLDRIAQGYKWRDLYNDPGAKSAIEKAVNENIASLVERQTNNQEFFSGWSALVQKPTPKNNDLAAAIAAEQNNVASAQAAEAKARADRAAAEAQIAVARAEAAKKQAEIKGYGGFENYNRAKCVEAGCNPYQPTYVFPGQPASK